MYYHSNYLISKDNKIKLKILWKVLISRDKMSINTFIKTIMQIVTMKWLLINNSKTS